MKTVVVHMVSDDVFAWQKHDQKWFVAAMKRAPRGPGDVYVLDVEGKEVHLNGNSAQFVALEVRKDG